jgi:Tfp pilus assembly protein FimT
MRSTSRKREAGYSLVEVTMSCVVILIVAAISIPNIMSAVHLARLRSAASDFSSITQVGRIRAVQDDRFYSVRILAGPPQEDYVDIYPQSTTGASGNGGTSVASNDPANPLPAEVTPEAAASAPNTSNLTSKFLPAGSLLVPKDGSATATPVTFSPRGLPCASVTATGGTVCDSSGGAVAFWVFFQDSYTSAWEAVTVSPAGRIRKWIYSGTVASGGWSPL